MIQAFVIKNLQSAAILHKKMKILIFIFFNFNSSFFQNNFRCNIPLGLGFSTIPNSSRSFKCSKSQ